MTTREWAFGPFLTKAIERSGQSKRAIARAAGISDARLRQLQDGFRKEAGGEVPVGTSPQTVASLSRVLGFPLNEGLALAGLATSGDESTTPATGGLLTLRSWTVAELLYEVRERFEELSGEAPAVPAPTARENQAMSVEELTARAATIVELEELAERRRADGDEEGAREVAQLAFDLNRQMHALAEEEASQAASVRRSPSSARRVERPRC